MGIFAKEGKIKNIYVKGKKIKSAYTKRGKVFSTVQTKQGAEVNANGKQ